MKRRRLTLIIGLLMTATALWAQGGNGITGMLKSFGQHLDSSAINKYDARYIEVPDRPWRVILRDKMDENIVDFINSNTIRYEGTDINTRLALTFDSHINNSIGLWVGYRGLGFAYYYKPDKKPGINLALSATAAKIGFNFRFRSMQTSKLHINFEQSDGDSTLVDDMDAELTTFIDITSFYLNAYYVFNGSRYSQGAAYNQVVVQRKSAGSLLLGLTAYASSVDLNTSPLNGGVVSMADSLGYISLGKISLGLGYGYNWVPAKGWIVNAMVMPNISISDNIIRKKYDCNYDYTSAADVDDYGTWDKENHRWENGMTRKPIVIGDDVADWRKDIDMWEKKTDSQRTCLDLNIDLRMGVAYCWKRYFASANIIFEHYDFGRDRNKVDIIDWYATASLGIRL